MSDKYSTEVGAIKRALVAHQTLAYSPEDQVCACDRKWRKHYEHREHLADAIYLATRTPTRDGGAR